MLFYLCYAGNICSQFLVLLGDVAAEILISKVNTMVKNVG